MGSLGICFVFLVSPELLIILLHEGAGGYVLVGVISFSTAVMITVLCIRLREREHRGQGTGKGNASQQREGK